MRWLKIVGWVLLSLIIIIGLLVVSPFIPPVQRKLVSVVKDQYRKKTGKELIVSKVIVRPDGVIVLEGVDIRDDKDNPFIRAQKLHADLSVRSLIDGEFVLDDISISGGDVHIEKRRDGSFNFDFLSEAFASKNKSSAKKKTIFKLGDIVLTNTTFTFSDRKNRMYTKMYVRHLDTRFEKFDPDEQIYHIAHLNLQGGNGYMVDLSEPDKASGISSKESKLPDVYFSSADIQNTSYLVFIKSDALTVKNDVAHLHVMTSRFDLNESVMQFASVKISNGGTVVSQGMGIEDIDSTSESKQWRILGDKVVFNNVRFAYDDISRNDSLMKGFDPASMKFRNVNLVAENVESVGSSVNARISSGSLVSKDGFRLKTIKGDFNVSPQRIKAERFLIATTGSFLAGSFESKQRNYSSFSKEMGTVTYNVNLASSKLSMKDVMYFVPELDTVTSLKPYRDLVAGVSGKAYGTLKSLQLNNFRGSVNGSYVNVSGKLNNLDSTQILAYDLNIADARVLNSSMPLILPDTNVRKKFRAPDESTFAGRIAGNMDSTFFDLDLKSTNGDAVVNGILSGERYNVEGDLASFNLGYIIKRKEIGPLTGHVKLDGAGFQPDSAIAELDVKLARSQILKYYYDSISANVRLNKGQLAGNLRTNDPAAKVSLQGEGKVKGKRLDLEVTGKVDTLDLRATGFSKDTTSLSGDLDLSYHGEGLDNFAASGKAGDLKVRRGRYMLEPDSLLFNASAAHNTVFLDVRSTLIDAELKGVGKFDQLATSIPVYLNQHFKFRNEKPADTLYAGQRVDFSIDVKNPNVLAPMFMPGLTSTPFVLKGQFNSDNKTLTADAKAKRITYNGTTVDTVAITVRGDADDLSATLSSPRFISREMIFPNPSVSLIASNDTLSYKVAVTGNDKTQRLMIAGQVESKGEGAYALSVAKDGFVLNNKAWNVTGGNKILFDSSGVIVNDFNINSGDRFLAVDQAGKKSVRISMKDFELMDLSMIPDSNRFPVGGTFSGEVYLPFRNVAQDTQGSFSISNFNFRKDTLGTVAGSVKKHGENALALEASIIGNGNTIKASGIYSMHDNYSPFDFKMNAEQINFAALKPYTRSIFKEISGSAKATFTLRGTPRYPVLDGDFVIHEASVLPIYTNSWIKTRHQSIHVDQSSFELKNFLLTDSMNNPALLNGYVCPEGLPHVNFDVVMVTSNFLALNTKEGDNETYFGKASVTSISHLYGDDITPFMDVSAKLNGGSRFTLMVHEQKLRAEQREGVVEFVNPSEDALKELLHKRREEPSFSGITLNSNIEVDEESQFKLLIDPVAGDSLSVRGKTTFSFGIDPGGKMSMTGVYEVTEGTYLLTLTKGLKKRFDLQRGSKITWSGDPLQPELDVSALYTVRAAPYDLIVGDVTQDQETRNSYRQEMPFLVNLKMAGQLYKPTVSFNIQLPQDQQGALDGTVYARLNQLNQNESELNTQVFSLLVLNRFYNEQEFLASQTSAFATYARTGLSRIVSQRLNAVATTYANFVELQLDVDFYDSYYQGQLQNTTNLRVGVGRKFFGERLDVRTGGTVVVQGPPLSETGNNLPSLVTAEYKLTRDGRYRLTGFRKNTYEGVFEGQITSEGGGIVFIRDFNSFNEIFKRPEETDLLDAAPRPRP